ncbi:C25 family cysteine peptidase [Flexithrix dorotheae]|uniref:putative type IX secretion system sortase PorU2 n=1 Tax=Flexithrix dorotheae TaxID=70993 RepID=UPI00036F2AF5|nr:C25 family cysteine peptidase [Flexithrix dorotheae]
MGTNRFILLFLYLIPLFFSPFSFAQVIENEWINYDQQYYKIGVSREGIFRVSFEELQNGGFPVNTVNPQHIQLFFRGKEQPIFIAGEADGVFNPGDYIEFYGTKNDGWLDTEFYPDPISQTDPFASMYSNQTFCFLTYTLDESLGKRIKVNNETDPGLVAKSYHLQEEVIHFTTDFGYNKIERYFSSGRLYPKFFQSISNEGALLSGFDEGKGFTDLYAGGTTKKDYKIPIKNLYASGPNPTLEVKMTGRSNTVHQVKIYAGKDLGSQRELGTLNFSYYDNSVLSTTLNFSDLPTIDDSLVVSYQIEQLTTNYNEIVSLSYIKLIYPQEINADGAVQKVFNVPRDDESQIKVEIENVPANHRLFDITSVEDKKEILGTLDGSNTFTSVISGTGKNARLLLTDEIYSIDTIGLTNISRINTAANYFIISHPALMKSANGSDDPVLEYANYRASTEGGGYQVYIADIQNIYNQFTFGEVTPLAIRRFAEYLLNNGNPEFFFIVGKGLAINYNYEKNKPASNSWTYKNLVPCFGEPCSDNMLTSGLKGSIYEPAIPTGRLSANTPQQVLDYLNKVKEHESFEFNDLWKKNALFLSGGKTVQEHNLLKFHTLEFKSKVEGDFIGAKGEIIQKGTTGHTEFIDISDEINAGIGIVTSFGHSSIVAADLEFGYASDPIRGFENKGKYPFMFMMGCDIGNVFARTRSVGEDWILTPEKGAIGFLAHSYLAFADTQAEYAKKFFDRAFTNKLLYNKPIGVVLQEAIKDYVELRAHSERDWSNAQQFVYSGDPAIRLYPIEKPDYHIADDKLFIQKFDETEELTVQTDSFKIGIVISNFGTVDKDSFNIEVKRNFNDGSFRFYDPIRVPPISYQDTIYFTIPVTKEDKLVSGGNSTFEVVIDASGEIDELDESNNFGQLNLFLPKTNMIIITPREFSIVKEEKVSLFAQNNDPLTPDRFYQFQIDTAAQFNSPVLKDTLVFAGVTSEWETDLLSGQTNDSTVYFWRVKYSDTSEDESWAESSFTYIKDSPEGWSQSEFPQFEKNKIENLELNNSNKKWEFKREEMVLKVQAVGDENADPANYHLYVNDFLSVGQGICAINNLVTYAIDQFSGKPYSIPVYPHLKCGYGDRGDAYRLLDNDLRNYNFMTFYMSFIKEGDYVVIFSAGKLRYEDYSDENFAGFAEMGIDVETMKSTLKNGDPFIAFGRKGAAPGTATEIYPRYTSATPSNAQLISGEFTIDFDAIEGNVLTPRIGPAENWGSIYLNIKEENATEDDWFVDVIGISLQGEESTVLSNIKAENTDISMIDANTYPYLKLQAFTSDTTSKTPAQLHDWKVLYEEVPEGILFYDTVLAQTTIPEIEEGDSINFKYKFENVTQTDFKENLVVRYALQNESTNKQLEFYDTLSNLPAKGSIPISVDLGSIEWVGLNKLNVYVNPRVLKEQIYENNILETKFKVNKDSTNPILDVVFDGVHIMNGELVSPTPLITISLKDENKFLVREDTVGLEIFMSNCDSCDFRKIEFNSPNVNWTRVNNNDFQVYYQPDKLPDGKYTLMVKGSDKSGNASGLAPYRISFEVENESKVTHFYPYPNPFSDHVQFVFTLTGAEIPDELKIQIMTVTGRVVREITQDEIGTIRIGNNRTEYAWDGRDEFGDQLANGVYLYRVFVRSNGQEIEHRETSKDDMFKNGFGKMYLMR